jgi:hypothetical protein
MPSCGPHSKCTRLGPWRAQLGREPLPLLLIWEDLGFTTMVAKAFCAKCSLGPGTVPQTSPSADSTRPRGSCWGPRAEDGPCLPGDTG